MIFGEAGIRCGVAPDTLGGRAYRQLVYCMEATPVLRRSIALP